MSVETIYDHERVEGSVGLLALVIRRDYRSAGVRFFTHPDEPLQFASLQHPAGHKVEPHIHRVISRVVRQTQEALFVRRGRVRLTVYACDGEPVARKVLEAGDVAVLLQGGHGLEALEDTEMFEVKQGPYVGVERDKVKLTVKG